MRTVDDVVRFVATVCIHYNNNKTYSLEELKKVVKHEINSLLGEFEQEIKKTDRTLYTDCTVFVDYAFIEQKIKEIMEKEK